MHTCCTVLESISLEILSYIHHSLLNIRANTTQVLTVLNLGMLDFLALSPCCQKFPYFLTKSVKDIANFLLQLFIALS